MAKQHGPKENSRAGPPSSLYFQGKTEYKRPVIRIVPHVDE